MAPSRARSAATLTGNERLLAAYRQYSTAVWSDVARSQALSFGGSQRPLNQVSELLRKRLSLAERTVRIAQTQGFDEARRVVLTGNGAQSSEQLRSTLSSMQAEQNRLLSERSAAAASNIRLTLWMLAGLDRARGRRQVLRRIVRLLDSRSRQPLDPIGRVLARQQPLELASALQFAAEERQQATGRRLRFAHLC